MADDADEEEAKEEAAPEAGKKKKKLGDLPEEPFPAAAYQETNKIRLELWKAGIDEVTPPREQLEAARRHADEFEAYLRRQLGEEYEKFVKRMARAALVTSDSAQPEKAEILFKQLYYRMLDLRELLDG